MACPRRFERLALIALLLLQSSCIYAQRYTLTVYADRGKDVSAAASQGLSSQGSNLGHLFVALTHGEKQMYLAYYGDPKNPSRGHLRVDADLARNGSWDVQKTYQITEEGYRAAHETIDNWGSQVGTWKP